MTNLFRSPQAERFDMDRAEARESKGRLTYDCFCATTDGERVACSEGHLMGLGITGTVRLAQVLRGTKIGACQKCPEYNGD